MYFFKAFNILVFALSVNAASVNKRCDVSVPAQTCIDSMAVLSQALIEFDASAGSFLLNQSYTGMLTVQIAEINAEGNMTTSITNCCAITSTLIDCDPAAVLSEESTVANSFISMINTYINKEKPQIDQLTLMPLLTDGNFVSIRTKMTSLLNCLTAMMPSDSTSAAQGYSTSILNSVQQGIIAFNETTTTTTTTVKATTTA